jgi:excisionase family DNA binding protein
VAAYLTPSGLAQQWAVSRRTVLRLIERGELHAVRVGEQWRIPAGAVEVYEAEHTAQPGEPQPRPSQPLATVPVSLVGFDLPADYEPVFPHRWGRESSPKNKAVSHRE